MTTDAEGRLLLTAALGAGMAHELRNVLAAAETSLYLVARSGDDAALRDKHVEAARRHVRVAQGLVDRALAPARGVAVASERIGVATLGERAAAVARLGEGHVLELDLGRELEVAGDELLLERALVNLIENASLAAKRPIRIRLTARSIDEAHVSIEVRDDGDGIPAEVRARLFEPLVTARDGGTGLGLPLVRAIAEAHGGHVEVASDGGGTCVSLTLPGGARATP